MTFVEVAVTSIGKGSLAVKGRLFKTAVTFVGGAVVFVKGGSAVGRSFKMAVMFIGKGSLAAGGRLFETARARARVIDDVKGVDERDLRR